jgi:hypothetical protein
MLRSARKMGRKSHVSVFLGIIGGLIILIPGILLLAFGIIADPKNTVYQPEDFSIRINAAAASFSLICGGLATGAGIIGLVGGLLANSQTYLAGFLEFLAAISLILGMLFFIPNGSPELLYIIWLLGALIWAGPLLAGGSLALISDQF